jgi:ferrochelatase
VPCVSLSGACHPVADRPAGRNGPGRDRDYVCFIIARAVLSPNPLPRLCNASQGDLLEGGMSDVSSEAGPAGGRIGVVLSNLGTPDGTGYRPMRRYLKEFLSDRRVVDVNPVLWWAILNMVILTIRPARKGRDYAKVWNRDRDESPLKTISRAQAEALSALLAADDPRIAVEWGMRYGNPSIASAIDRLAAQGCDRILLLPLYPQYAAATSATACDAAFRHLMTLRRQPVLRVAPPYFAEPGYIDAVADSIRRGVAALDFVPEVIVASFHGLPRRVVEAGDPYRDQCLETARLLQARLGLADKAFATTFQSRFGREEWLRPYTDETLRAMAQRGVKRVAVVAPGFAADCIETLEELDMENRGIFLASGGERFAYIPCLNDSAGGMAAIATLARRELAGWIGAAPGA